MSKTRKQAKQANEVRKNLKVMTPLMAAAQKNQLTKVQALLSEKADVNDDDQDGATALVYGLENNAVEVVKLLHEAGAKISGMFNTGSELDPTSGDDKLGYTAVMVAAECGSFEACEYLLQFQESKDEIDTSNHEGWTPLLLAAEAQKWKVVTLLIEHGADVTLAGPDGSTPLMFASDFANEEVAKLLLEHGAELDTMDKDGDSALVRAVQSKHQEFAKMLIDMGSDLKILLQRLEHCTIPLSNGMYKMIENASAEQDKSMAVKAQKAKKPASSHVTPAPRARASPGPTANMTKKGQHHQSSATTQGDNEEEEEEEGQGECESEAASRGGARGGAAAARGGGSKRKARTLSPTTSKAPLEAAEALAKAYKKAHANSTLRGVVGTVITPQSLAAFIPARPPGVAKQARAAKAPASAMSALKPTGLPDLCAQSASAGAEVGHLHVSEQPADAKQEEEDEEQGGANSTSSGGSDLLLRDAALGVGGGSSSSSAQAGARTGHKRTIAPSPDARKRQRKQGQVRRTRATKKVPTFVGQGGAFGAAVAGAGAVGNWARDEEEQEDEDEEEEDEDAMAMEQEAPPLGAALLAKYLGCLRFTSNVIAADLKKLIKQPVIDEENVALLGRQRLSVNTLYSSLLQDVPQRQAPLGDSDDEEDEGDEEEAREMLMAEVEEEVRRVGLRGFEYVHKELVAELENGIDMLIDEDKVEESVRYSKIYLQTARALFDHHLEGTGAGDEEEEANEEL